MNQSNGHIAPAGPFELVTTVYLSAGLLQEFLQEKRGFCRTLWSEVGCARTVYLVLSYCRLQYTCHVTKVLLVLKVVKIQQRGVSKANIANSKNG